MTQLTTNDTESIITNPDIVFGDVDGHIVALNMKSGSYLHLNSTGTFIFKLLHESGPQPMKWLLNRVEQEFAVDSQTCRAEVGAFVTRCIGLGLLLSPPR